MELSCKHYVVRTVVSLIIMAVGSAASADDRFANSKPYITDAMRQWHVPGLAIAVVNDGQIVFIEGFGVRKLGHSASVDSTTLFAIASLSKSFTAATAAILVDEAKLQWDEPVRRHYLKLKLFDDYLTKHVSLRDLLSHRTGLARGDLLPRRGWNCAEIIRRMQFLQPEAGFRTQFGYSNVQYILAGETISRAAGKPWEELVSQRIFAPLNMHSTVPFRPHPLPDDYASHHRLRGEQVVAVNAEDGNRIAAAAYGIQSNAQEMTHWMKCLLAGGEYQGRQILSTDSINEMFAIHCSIPIRKASPENIYAAKFYGWGLGWGVLDYRGKKIVTHYGGSGVQIGLMPEENLGVVVLTNLEATNLAGMLMYDVFDAFLVGADRAWDRGKWKLWQTADEHPDRTLLKQRAEAQKQRQPDLPYQRPLAEYTGNYANQLNGDLTIGQSATGLTLQFGPNRAVPLSHWSGETFYARLPVVDEPYMDWLCTFKPAENGKVESINVRRLGWRGKSIPPFHRQN